MTESVFFALAMTSAAGLSTGIGSLFAFISKRNSPRFLGGSMGFSAGVTVFISMAEILPKGQSLLCSALGEKAGYGVMLAAFFGGMLLCFLTGKFLPEETDGEAAGRMKRAGLITAIILAVHNLPEGLTTFVTAMAERESALTVAIAIALHNIPEGISVSLPLTAGGMKRGKAFCLSFLSGLTEPLGGVVGFLLLMPFLCDALLGGVYGAVAGLMMWVTFDGLLPCAEENGGHRLTMAGLFAGMAVMAISMEMLL